MTLICSLLYENQGDLNADIVLLLDALIFKLKKTPVYEKITKCNCIFSRLNRRGSRTKRGSLTPQGDGFDDHYLNSSYGRMPPSKLPPMEPLEPKKKKKKKKRVTVAEDYDYIT